MIIRIIILVLLLLWGAYSWAGEVTLTCTDPTLNEDGTPLTDLQGVKIYESTIQGGPYVEILDVSGCAVIPVLQRTEGTYYFVATAYNTQLVESAYSNEATKTVTTVPNPPGNLVASGNLVAYSISQSPNVFLTYPIGTVTQGVPCDPNQTANGLYRVDIEYVTMPEGVSARVAFAECSDG